MLEHKITQRQRRALRIFRKASTERAATETAGEAKRLQETQAAQSALSQVEQTTLVDLSEASRALETAKSRLDVAKLAHLIKDVKPSKTPARREGEPAKEFAKNISTAIAVPAKLQSQINSLEEWRVSDARRRLLTRLGFVGLVLILCVALIALSCLSCLAVSAIAPQYIPTITPIPSDTPPATRTPLSTAIPRWTSTPLATLVRP